MDEYDQDSSSNLGTIKRQIIDELRPLIGHLKDPQDRYYALSSLLQEKWDESVIKEAFEAAKNIQDPEDKVHALQGLLSDISLHERDLEEQK